MGGDGSAYAALGLEPGADRESVERAYRELIKHHHPDRAGGNAARAAEIIGAYRELRRDRPRDDLVFHDADGTARPRFGGWWMAVAIALAAASLGLLFVMGQDTPLIRTAERLAPALGARAAEPMRAPLAASDIDAGVREAVRIARSGDEMELTSTSRACHDRLRAAPSVALLDRCAAFDDAVVKLQDRDPLRDRGRFGELAVTGRQWSAAKALSDNFEAIDDRLGQVRLRVELLLAGMGDDRTP
ncbi:MAG: J domain-containing protein [Sphingomicrobium sp.]